LKAVVGSYEDTKELITRMNKATEFIKQNKTISGIALAKLLVNTNMLNEELIAEFTEIIELEPELEQFSIPDIIFTLSTYVFLTLYAIGRLPDGVVSCPKETIDFKFDAESKTLIIDEKEIVVFDSSLDPVKYSIYDFSEALKNIFGDTYEDWYFIPGLIILKHLDHVIGERL